MSIQIERLEVEGGPVQGPSCVAKQKKPKKTGRRIAVIAVIACVLGPCCWPLLLPLVGAFAAGTPLALWAGQNLGWMSGVLALVVTLVIAMMYRWWRKRAQRSGGAQHED